MGSNGTYVGTDVGTKNDSIDGAASNDYRKLWEHPDPQSTQMWKFMQLINHEYGQQFKNYPELFRWSIENVPELWGKVWDFCGIRASQPYTEV